MPRKQKWVVRVIASKTEVMGLQPDQTLSMFLEQLRYAGLVSICKEEWDKNGERDRIVFDIYPPKGVDAQIWADQNAKRMKSFMINAAAAPAWNQ